MPKTSLQTHVALAVAATMLFGCGTLDPSEFVDVRVTLSDSLVTASGSIEIDVTARNRGTTDIQVDPHGCPQIFEILDDTGAIVGPEYVVCTLALRPPRTLRPGESISFDYVWSGDGIGFEDSRLPAGPYSVRGFIRVVGEGTVYGPPRAIRVLERADGR